MIAQSMGGLAWVNLARDATKVMRQSTALSTAGHIQHSRALIAVVRKIIMKGEE